MNTLPPHNTWCRLTACIKITHWRLRAQQECYRLYVGHLSFSLHETATPLFKKSGSVTHALRKQHLGAFHLYSTHPPVSAPESTQSSSAELFSISQARLSRTELQSYKAVTYPVKKVAFKDAARFRNHTLKSVNELLGLLAADRRPVRSLAGATGC